jgi:site-specific recombinase XerD
VGRQDIKRTLRRWMHPSTQAKRHSILASFYQWCMFEGIRETNPAAQVRRAKAAPVSRYRLTADEVARVLSVPVTVREQRVAFLMLLAGVRNAELRGLRVRDFARAGFIEIPAEVAKGGRPRTLPVVPELQRIVDDIRASGDPDHFILGRSSAGGWGPYAFEREDPTRPMSSQTVQRCVHQLAKRAGFEGKVTPHTLRHAHAEHIARHLGVHIAKELLGHADIATTQIYTGRPSLDDLRQAIEGVGPFMPSYPPTTPPASPEAEREGFEPSNEVDPRYAISSRARSTAPAPLRDEA